MNKFRDNQPLMKCDKCVLFAVFTMFFITLDTIAGELILDQNLLEKVSKKSQENPYRIKQVIGSKDAFVFELGNPVTPFFQDEATKTVKRRYRSAKNCFEISFHEKLNLAIKTDCRQVMSDLKLPGFPDFHAAKVSDLLDSSLKDFEFWNESNSYQLKGFVHSRETIEMDQRILNLKDTGSFPTQLFQVKTEAIGNVALDSKFGLSITQQTSLFVGKIGIQDQSDETITNIINRTLNDLIFTDGRGRIIVINSLLLPLPFQNSLLSIQPKFSRFLSELENRSTRSAVCFRDSWMGNSDQDCQHMVIKKIRPFEFKAFSLLMVNFQDSSVIQIR